MALVMVNFPQTTRLVTIFFKAASRAEYEMFRYIRYIRTNQERKRHVALEVEKAWIMVGLKSLESHTVWDCEQSHHCITILG